MRADGLTTLTAVAGFLDDEVVLAVPPEMAGEVRAAAKLLRTAATELAVRHREVAVEIDDLLALCEVTEPDAVRLLRSRATEDLAAQEDVREQVHELASHVMARLDGLGLDVFLHCLGEHAARRQSWQAVFPVPEGAR